VVEDNFRSSLENNIPDPQISVQIPKLVRAFNTILPSTLFRPKYELEGSSTLKRNSTRWERPFDTGVTSRRQTKWTAWTPGCVGQSERRILDATSRTF